MAAQSTRLATTVLRVQGQEFQTEGGSHSKAPLLASAERAGGRVGTNPMMRDLDLPVLATDSRLEVVVDGLPLFGGCQLAVDTTLVCAMHCDGTPHDGAANRDGVVLEAARRRKERRYPELVGPRSRARLVVLAVEVGGALVSRNQVSCGPTCQGKVSSGNTSPSKTCHWRLRWAGILACATAKAVATSLLELKVAHGSDGDIPSCSEVVGDHRYDGLV